MAISYEFLTARIDKTEQMIIVYEDAVLALGVGGQISYTMDTGQTRQTVTNMDLKRLKETIDSLMNTLATLCARRDGTGVTRVVPSC